jgi:hypothetical protein
MLSSCIIEDPPPYSEPKQTPPRLDLRRAAPPYDQVLIVKLGERVTFNVPVSSEDAGDKIIGLLLLDYAGQDDLTDIARGEAPAATLDDVDRNLIVDWPVAASATKGCHRLTLLVTHRDNYFFGKGLTNKADSAVAPWNVFVIDPDDQNVPAIVDCPVATTEQQ